MTAPLTLSALMKTARSVGTRTAIDAAATAGRLELYSDARPAAGVAQVGSRCVVISLDDPCGTVDAAGLHLIATVPGQASQAGVITWGRIVTGDGDYLIDGNVHEISNLSDGRDVHFVIDVAQVYPGSFVSLVSALLAEGG